MEKASSTIALLFSRRGSTALFLVTFCSRDPEQVVFVTTVSPVIAKISSA